MLPPREKPPRCIGAVYKSDLFLLRETAPMKNCPYCGYSNYDHATLCRKCDNSIVATGGTVYQARTYWIGPDRAKVIRGRALAMIVLGLLIEVYWGGYGPWPTIDFPILVTLRQYLEPLLLYGGAVLWVFGWIACYI